MIPLPIDDAPIWNVLAHYPLRSRVLLSDGHTGEVVGVGLSRGVLCAWVTGRPATPVGEIVRRA